jgi:ABC-type multidrug transport system permease subunit
MRIYYLYRKEVFNMSKIRVSKIIEYIITVAIIAAVIYVFSSLFYVQATNTIPGASGGWSWNFFQLIFN